MISNEEESLADLVGRAVDDAKAVARAEIEVAKARALSKARGYRAPLILFGIAIALAMGAEIGLIVGLILSLATLIGPGFATLAIVLGSALIAYICARVGIAKL